MKHNISFFTLLAITLSILAACDNMRIKALVSKQVKLMEHTIQGHFGTDYTVTDFESQEVYNIDKTQIDISFYLRLNRPLPIKDTTKNMHFRNQLGRGCQSITDQMIPPDSFYGKIILKKVNGSWQCTYNTVNDPEKWKGVLE